MFSKNPKTAIAKQDSILLEKRQHPINNTFFTSSKISPESKNEDLSL
jgi:hypothetical protein